MFHSLRLPFPTLCAFFALIGLTLLPPRASAQDPSSPSAPKNDRIVGLLPNYATVEDGQQLPPLSAPGKFDLVAEGTFDPAEFGFVGVVAATNEISNENPAWGRGLLSYAKYYATGFANQSVGNFMTGAVFPAAFHQDPRYYRLGKGNVPHRMAYALRALVVIRSDSGQLQPNAGEFAGNFSAAAIANLYAPKNQRTWSETRLTFGQQVMWDGVAFQIKEWWPDLKHHLGHKQ